MKFYLLTLTHLTLLYLLASVSMASSQDFSSQSSVILSETLPTMQQRSTDDELYRDGCTAILKGFDDIYSSQSSYDDFFSTWENVNPNIPFLSYFEKNNGLVIKTWTTDTYTSGWKFELKIYDGNYIDTKFAKVEISGGGLKMLQSNGTFQQDDLTLTFTYGESNKAQLKKSVTGTLSLYFINKDTKKPITSFDKFNTNIERDSVQIMFVSSDGKMSFKTSLFSKTYMSTFDYIICYLFPVIYLILTLLSRYSEPLFKKVSPGSIQAAYTYAAFMIGWFAYKPYFYGLPYFIFLAPAVVDVFKCMISTIIGSPHHNPSNCQIICTSCSIFFFALTFISNVWVDLFPSLLFLGPLISKIMSKTDEPQHYLTRVELCAWGCMCLWMGYTHLYPGNYYLFSPKPLLASIFFGLVFLQFSIALIMERRQPKPKIIDPFLQEESMGSNQAPQTSYSQEKIDQQEHAKKTKTPVKPSKNGNKSTDNIL